jgi:hypothetical protein
MEIPNVNSIFYATFVVPAAQVTKEKYSYIIIRLIYSYIYRYTRVHIVEGKCKDKFVSMIN